MVGRALRGVLQGGTSEAYLVEFGDEQLDKVLWEVPEEKDNLEDFLKKHSILFGTQGIAGDGGVPIIHGIDLASLDKLVVHNEEINDIIAKLCSQMPVVVVKHFCNTYG